MRQNTDVLSLRAAASAKTLKSWLDLSYGLSYRRFQRLPKEQRDRLRAQYTAATGNRVAVSGVSKNA